MVKNGFGQLAVSFGKKSGFNSTIVIALPDRSGCSKKKYRHPCPNLPMKDILVLNSGTHRTYVPVQTDVCGRHTLDCFCVSLAPAASDVSPGLTHSNTDNLTNNTDSTDTLANVRKLQLTTTHIEKQIWKTKNEIGGITHHCGTTGIALDLRSIGRRFKSYSRQCCVTTLGKLFTPTCLCCQAV